VWSSRPFSSLLTHEGEQEWGLFFVNARQPFILIPTSLWCSYLPSVPAHFTCAKGSAPAVPWLCLPHTLKGCSPETGGPASPFRSL
jgi:hypothetical protein